MNQDIRNDVIKIFERKLEQFKNKQMTEEDEWIFFKFFLREKFKEDPTDIDIKYFTLGWYIYNYVLPKQEQN